MKKTNLVVKVFREKSQKQKPILQSVYFVRLALFFKQG